MFQIITNRLRTYNGLICKQVVSTYGTYFTGLTVKMEFTFKWYECALCPSILFCYNFQTFMLVKLDHIA